ncbi:MAG TPA: peptidylprolyl isomerase, partial [Egibacteraceae bacterium]|nr:peptidylprolyl isomerase [Egibacteraceae bacterium]
DLGEIRRGELTGSFEDAVFSAAAGQVVGPVRTEFGWHVARVEAVTPAAGIPYPQARAALRAELLAAARQRAFDHWLAGRTAELARLAPDWLHPGDPRGGDPIHRH